MSWKPYQLSLLQIATKENLNRVRDLLGRYASLAALTAALAEGREDGSGRRRFDPLELADALADPQRIASACRLAELARLKGARPIRRGTSEYPADLERIAPAPELIWMRGTEVPPGPRVAVVGARRSDMAGLELAYALARELGQRGVVVVSGGAHGVDAAAHRGALDGGGSTIAVLGTGVLLDYPAQNRPLFRLIRERGCCISEYSPAAEPSPRHFPERNRSIVALAQHVVVVRAAARSGALITARIALEHGIPVFVADDTAAERFAGNHWLLGVGARPLREFRCPVETGEASKARENLAERRPRQKKKSLTY